MASVSQVGKNFRVQIRKKSIFLSANFRDKKTAELWSIYKESLIDEISEFDVPLSEMITLRDAMDLKIKSMKEEEKNSYEDIEVLKKDFCELLELPINKISYELLCNKYESIINKPVRRGGSENGNGIVKLSSIKTVYNRFKRLSTVFSYVIEEGVNVQNVPLIFSQFIHKQLIKEYQHGHEANLRTA